MEATTKYYDTKLDKLILTIIYVLLFLILILVLLPLMHIVACSFATADDIIEGKVIIFPPEISLVSYQTVFQNRDLLMGFLNSFFYSSLGPIISVSMCITLAYPLSRPGLPGKKWILRIMMMTMLFSGGLIPTYLVSRTIGITNSRWGFLFLESALNIYNVFVARTFFQNSIDQGIYDSAEIDGAGTMRCLVSIVLPLSKAVIAVLLLWDIVAYWNNYMNALVYLSDRDLQPLQVIIREIMELTVVDPGASADSSQSYADLRNLQVTLKYATIVVSSLPLMVIYPFVQKYFVKGVMLGSIKG